MKGHPCPEPHAPSPDTMGREAEASRDVLCRLWLHPATFRAALTVLWVWPFSKAFPDSNREKPPAESWGRAPISFSRECHRRW